MNIQKRSHTLDRIPPLAMILFFALCLASGCGDDDGGGTSTTTGPGPLPMLVQDGTFRITHEVAFDGCNLPYSYGTDFEITFDGSVFTMGDWVGEYTPEPNQLKAHGEGHRDQTALRDCLVTRWSTVDITFTSNNFFWGHVVYRKRAVGECTTVEQCQNSWLIQGRRVIE